MRRFFAALALALCITPVVYAVEQDEFNAIMSRGLQSLKQNKTDDAIKAYKKAVKLNPSSGEAYWGLAQAYNAAGGYKDVISACQRGLQVADKDYMKAVLHTFAGNAYEYLAENRAIDKLKSAEAEYRAAAGLSPAPPLLHFYLGRVLMRMSRDEEGIAELREFVATHGQASPDAPVSAFVHTAERMIANPRRAREPYLPDFSITTVDGRHISSDDLVGKIVVLDFWGTWCPPCRASVPELRSLSKRFANDPVVVIGISSDEDEEKWRRFIADNKMEWPQYLDKNHEIIKLFGVNSFPTYLMVDTEGIMRKVEHGSGSLGGIESEIKKKLKEVAKNKDQQAPPVAQQ